MSIGNKRGGDAGPAGIYPPAHLTLNLPNKEKYLDSDYC